MDLRTPDHAPRGAVNESPLIIPVSVWVCYTVGVCRSHRIALNAYTLCSGVATPSGESKSKGWKCAKNKKIIAVHPS